MMTSKRTILSILLAADTADSRGLHKQADFLYGQLLRIAAGESSQPSTSDEESFDYDSWEPVMPRPKVEPVKDYSADGLSPEEMQQRMLAIKGAKIWTPNDIRNHAGKYGPSTEHHLWVYPGGDVVSIPYMHTGAVGLVKRQLHVDKPDFIEMRPASISDPYEFFMDGSGGSIRVYISGRTMEVMVRGVPSEVQFKKLSDLRDHFGLTRTNIEYTDNHKVKRQFYSVGDLKGYIDAYASAPPGHGQETNPEHERNHETVHRFLHDWRVSGTKRTKALR